MQKANFARHLIVHAERLMKEADTELRNIEIAIEVLDDVPSSDEEVQALLHSAAPGQLMHDAQQAAMQSMVRAEQERVQRHRHLVAEHRFARQKDAVVAVCRQILSDGNARSTEELHALLQAQGVQLNVQNPVQRVSQILSENDSFRSVRGRGWMLLDALTVPRMTEREKDEWELALKREARQIVNKENNAR